VLGDQGGESTLIAEPGEPIKPGGIGIGFRRAQPAEVEEQRCEIGSHGGPSLASGDEDLLS
jgi:hypothetical protein